MKVTLNMLGGLFIIVYFCITKSAKIPQKVYRVWYFFVTWGDALGITTVLQG